MLSRREKKHTFGLLYAYRQAYNVGKSLGEQIRCPHLKTLDTLVNKYLEEYRRSWAALQIPDTSESRLDDLPALRITKAEIARLSGYGIRTTYNHLERLEAAGLILTKNRGYALSMELWISPYILFSGDEIQEILKNEKAQNSPIFQYFVQSFPQITNKNLINKNSHVDNKEFEQDTLGNKQAIGHIIGEIVKKGNDQDTGKHDAGTTQELAGTQRTKWGQTKKQAPKPIFSEKKAGTEIPAGGAGGAEALKDEFTRQVVIFWEYVKFIFYSQIDFGSQPEYEKICKNTLYVLLSKEYNQCFKHFEGKAGIKQYFEVVQKRAIMVQAWRGRNAARYVPPPTKYFDVDNAHGFHKTLYWYAKNQELNRRARAQVEANKAIKSLETGKIQGKKGVFSKIKIYQYHKERLERFGDEAALQAFLNHVAVYGAGS